MAGEAESGRDEGLFPVSSLWFELGMYLFFFGWLTYMLIETLAWESFEDFLFIYILAPVVYVLLIYRGAMLLVPDRLQFLDVLGGNEDHTDEDEAPQAEDGPDPGTDQLGRESKAEEEKYAIYMIVWTAALPIAMFFIGMAWALPIYIFGFTWFFTRNVWKAVLVTVASIGFIYVLFVELLNVLLWEGTLGLPNPVNYLP